MSRLMMLIRAAGATSTDCAELNTLITGNLALLQEAAHRNAVNKGFYDDVVYNDPEIAVRLCLIHSEVSEALEALRSGGPQSKKIDCKLFDEELADTVIRIMDLCGWLNIDLTTAVQKKMAYNLERPSKHGKVF